MLRDIDGDDLIIEYGEMTMDALHRSSMEVARRGGNPRGIHLGGPVTCSHPSLPSVAFESPKLFTSAVQTGLVGPMGTHLIVEYSVQCDRVGRPALLRRPSTGYNTRDDEGFNLRNLSWDWRRRG